LGIKESVFQHNGNLYCYKDINNVKQKCLFLEFDKKYEKVKNNCVNNLESYSQRFFQATCISFFGPFFHFHFSVFFLFLLTTLT